MPKIAYGIEIEKIASIKAEIETLKNERVNAFIEGNNQMVEYLTSKIMELTTDIEVLNESC